MSNNRRGERQSVQREETVLKAIEPSLTLYQLFGSSPSLGWEILDAESQIYGQIELTMERIMHLTSLYSAVIEKLNGMQDPREQFFSSKMQKLMAEPFIIRCFSNGQQSPQRNALDSRRKELELKAEKEAERQSHRATLEKTLQIQTEKEERIRKKVKESLNAEQKRLEERIQRRNMLRLEKSMDLSPTSSLSGSLDESRKFALSSDFEIVVDEQIMHRRQQCEVKRQDLQERQGQKLARYLGLNARRK